MVIAKFRRKIHVTGRGHYGLTIPLEVGQALPSRNVILELNEDGSFLVKPLLRPVVVNNGP